MENTQEKNIVFTTKELLNHYYPIFTNWALDKAIREKALPVIHMGRKRLFRKISIDKWLDEQEKIRNDKIEIRIL